MRQLIRDPAAPDRERGFIMPLCLVAIALLSLSAVILLSQVESATARAQFVKDRAEKEWARYTLEQQVVWRTLVESAAQRTANEFGAVSPQVSALRNEAGQWNNVSNDLYWRGVQGNSDLEDDRFIVRIQDARGLLDLNYTNADYLNFVAKVLDVPADSRRTAVAQLAERIADFRSANLVSDEGYRTRSIIGIDRPEDLCGLTRWSKIMICQQQATLFRFVTFGNGVLPNVDFTPSYLRAEMGVDDRETTSVSARISWENVQRSEGFYDAVQSTGASGFRYHIWLTDKRFDSSNFFVLSLEPDRQGRPFTVTNRIDTDVSRTLPN